MDKVQILAGLKSEQATVTDRTRGDIRDRPRDQATTDAGSIKPYSHPYYWAAFVLFGDPG